MPRTSSTEKKFNHIDQTDLESSVLPISYQVIAEEKQQGRRVGQNLENVVASNSSQENL